MPLYDYACPCGQRFERLVRREDPAPACPSCGGTPRRLLPTRVAMTGRAKLPPGPEQAPKTWEETHNGDRETITHWRRTLDERRKIEEKYPELAGDCRPVLAHEGPYAARPLRAGDHGHPHPSPPAAS